MNNRPLKQYYIAYFDILGYKNYFEEIDQDPVQFLQRIRHMCQEIQNKLDFNNDFFNVALKVKSFSDNFVIMLEPKGTFPDVEILKVITYIISKLQLRFLKNYSILIRGGITKGLAYIDENIVYGEGLIRAVELESKAQFPRIVLDNKRFNESDLESLCEKNDVAKDEDDMFYVDYLRLIHTEVSVTQAQMIRNIIIRLVKKYGKYKRSIKDENKLLEADKTISKYAWLLCKYNDSCLATEAVIPYRLDFYKKRMKTEIIIEANKK